MAASTSQAKAEEAGAAEVEHNPVESIECDVVVAGSGTAGICAALSAAQNGASVVLLEKLDTLYGTSRFTEGVGAVGSSVQKEYGIELDVQDMVAASAKYHHYACNQPVLKKFVEESGATIDWLIESGANFYGILMLGESPATWHLPNPEGGRKTGAVGTDMLPPLEEAARSLGVDIRTSTPLTGLVIEDGAVVGAYAQTADGEIQINASKGVVLATGGYGSNKELFDQFTHLDLDRFLFWGTPGHDGDGITMGLAAGAALHHPEAFMNALSIPPSTTNFEAPVCTVFGCWCNFQVNEQGLRFCCEGASGDFTYIGNTIAVQQKVVSILSEEEIAYAEETGPFVPVAGNFQFPPLTGLKDMILEDPDVTVFDTVEELAEYYGINAENLAASIERYNGFVDSGVDEDFGKPAQYLFHVQPPFYTTILIPSFYCTVGGLKVDLDMQVIDTNGAKIPGLFAVGSDAGGLYGFDYDVGTMSGSQQGWCATSGRLVGQYLMA